MKNKKGFTLIELLLSVALLSMIAGFSWPFFSNIKSSSLDSDTIRAVSVMRQAKVSSKTLRNDSSWGVYVNTNEITLFSGSSYASRDTSWDQVFQFTPEVTASSTQEIVFFKYSGIPTYIGDIILSNGSSDKTININNLGVISY